MLKLEDYFKSMVPYFPERVEKGAVLIERYSVSAEEAKMHNLRCDFKAGARFERIEPGTYVRMRIGGAMMMSDTPYEKYTNSSFFLEARGRVLVVGLGLGFAISAVARKPEVESITIIERNKDVIDLVYGQFPKPARLVNNIELVQSDVFEWEPPRGVKYDTIYADIWPGPCATNVKDMDLFKKKFQRCRSRVDGRLAWIGCWEEWRCRASARGEL